MDDVDDEDHPDEPGDADDPDGVDTPNEVNDADDPDDVNTPNEGDDRRLHHRESHSTAELKTLEDVHRSGMSTTETTIPVAVEAERESPTRASIEARDFELVVDEPEDMGIELADLEITIDGEFPLEVFETEKPEARTALQNIDVTLAPESSEDRETRQEWGERVEARCPVSDSIKHETGVDLTIQMQ